MTPTQAVTNSDTHDFAETFNVRVESFIAAVRSYESNPRESIVICDGDDVTRLVNEVLLRAKNDQSLLDAVFEHKVSWIRHDQIMNKDEAVFAEDYSKLTGYEALKPGSDLRAVRDVLRDELGYCGVELYDTLLKVVDVELLPSVLLNGCITTAEDLDEVLKAGNITATKTVRRI